MRLPQSYFIALTASAQIILMVVTWPLWFSQTDYPQIALLSFPAAMPLWLNQALSTVLLAGCLLIAVMQFKDFGPRSPISSPSVFHWLPCLLMLLCSVALVVLDQHRLQPWHWLTMLLLAQWTLLDQNDFRRTARVTLATIYVFASLSRFGPDVASGMSGQVLKVILQALNLDQIRPTDSRFQLLATIMNGAELLIGIALLFQRTRKAAVIAAVLLHGTLIACLSPWGLNHHVGVLVWNSFLMLAVPMLFWAQNTQQTEMGTEMATTKFGSWKTRLLIAVIVLIPTAGLFGFTDNWLAWQVYSPRPEVLKLTVDQSSVQYLPESLRPFVQPPQPLQSDCPIRLDRWSLQSKLVPMYPEDRFQIATAKWVVERAVQNGADKSAFQAQLTQPERFPWWKRSTVDVSL